MKVLLFLVLGLAGAAAQAEDAGPWRAAAERRATHFQAEQAKPSRAEAPQRSRYAAVAIALTDDADSILLPAFATRTTPLPIRFLRVGLEWRF